MRRRLGTFGGVRAGSGGGGGEGNVVADGMCGKAGGSGRRRVALRGGRSESRKEEGETKTKRVRAHGDAGRMKKTR